MPLILLKIFSILFFSYLLTLITQRIIKSLTFLSKISGLGQYATTAIVMALATSLPEISVALSSALNGLSNLSLGDALGSNIVNLSLVTGLIAVFGKSLHFNHDHENKKAFFPLLLTILPFFFILDKHITRTEGFVLLSFYVFYVSFLIKQPHHRIIKKITKGDTETRALKKAFKNTGQLLFFLLLLIGAAQAIVYISKSLAVDLGLPIMFVGFFIVAVGTSLPELVFGLKTVKQRRVSMALGNIIGSCVTNATLIIGLAALIHPITLSTTQVILLPAIEYFFIVSLFTFFTFTKHRLDRWEGLVLLGLFLYYTTIELL
jgi:cation:H+ antiporter